LLYSNDVLRQVHSLGDVPLIGIIILLTVVGFYLASSLGEIKFMKLNETTALAKEINMIKDSNNLVHTKSTTFNHSFKQASMLENIQMFIVGMVSSAWGAFA
jgi:hypothetical protein